MIAQMNTRRAASQRGVTSIVHQDPRATQQKKLANSGGQFTCIHLRFTDLNEIDIRLNVR